jgi:hypothetical protein
MARRIGEARTSSEIIAVLNASASSPIKEEEARVKTGARLRNLLQPGKQRLLLIHLPTQHPPLAPR